MPAPEEPIRPRAVTVIGWLWLVFAVLLLFRSVVNLVVWRILEPDMPELLALDGASPLQLPFLRPLLEHVTAIQAAQAIVASAVIFLSIELLRLRPWARVAFQALCWLVIATVAFFAAFWVWLWGRLAALSETPARSLENIGILAGLAFCFAVAAGMAVMIALLRGSRVRAAFGPPPPAAASRLPSSTASVAPK